MGVKENKISVVYNPINITKPKKVKTTVVNEQYEILDTDELTSKIKEYDSKIAELDKMLKDMDKLKENKQEEKKTKKVREENFLKGNRIKVVSEEETKNKKRVNIIISILCESVNCFLKVKGCYFIFSKNG